MTLEEDVLLGTQIEVIAESRAFLVLLESLEEDARDAQEQAALVNVRSTEGQLIHDELKVRVLAYKLLRQKVAEWISRAQESDLILQEHDRIA